LLIGRHGRSDVNSNAACRAHSASQLRYHQLMSRMM
jgi:hypothetical protein